MRSRTRSFPIIAPPFRRRRTTGIPICRTIRTGCFHCPRWSRPPIRSQSNQELLRQVLQIREVFFPATRVLVQLQMLQADDVYLQIIELGNCALRICRGKIQARLARIQKVFGRPKPSHRSLAVGHLASRARARLARAPWPLPERRNTSPFFGEDPIYHAPDIP